MDVGPQPKSFRDFVWGTSIVGMGVGMAMGMAVMGVVTLVVKDIILPSLCALVLGEPMDNLFVVVKDGSPPGPYRSMMAADQAGAITVHYGMVLVGIVSFLFVALTMILILKKSYRVQAQLNQPNVGN